MTEAGEILPSIGEVFQKDFRKCMDQNKHRREPYFILVTGNWYANYTQLKLTYTPMDFKPPMMLNTMLWRIDNKAGRIEEIWVLPFDDPDGIYDPRIPGGEVDESIIKWAPHLSLRQN